MRSESQTHSSDIKDIFEEFLSRYRDGKASAIGTATAMHHAGLMTLPEEDSQRITAFEGIMAFCKGEKHLNRMAPEIATRFITEAAWDFLPHDHASRAQVFKLVIDFSREAMVRNRVTSQDVVSLMYQTTAALFSDENPEGDQLCDIFKKAIQDDGSLNLRPAREALDVIDHAIKTAPKKSPFGPQQPR